MSHPGLEDRDPIQDLEELSPSLRAAFAAACADRLLPAYLRFARRTGRGAPEDVAAIRERLWRGLEGEPTDPRVAREDLERCARLIPGDDEEEWVPELPMASDAVAALTYAVRCHQNGSAQDAARAARRVYEALDEWIMESEGVDTTHAGAVDRVLAHPLIRAETVRQARDIRALLAVRDAGEVKNVVAVLRERAALEASIVFG